MAIKGTAGNDIRTGTAGDDLFKLAQGGDDTATGLGGNDIFKMNAALSAGDAIDGGADIDRVDLKGDYSAGLVFGATTITNIETLRLAGAFDYNLTFHDGNVAAGQHFNVNATKIGGGHGLIFNGAAELNGSFYIRASTGSDTITGGAKYDYFYLTQGGDDTAYGGGGSDEFYMNAAFSAADTLDGGTGTEDELKLNGDYSGGVTFGAATLTNFEAIGVVEGHSYSLTTDDATVASGASLRVHGEHLAADESLVFDGSAETNGAFDLTGGAGNDNLTGGSGNDTMDAAEGIDDLTGGLGADSLTGGTGIDRFHYGAVAESASTTHDVITGFNAADDFFDLHVAVAGYDGQVGSSIAINQATFDANLTVATAGAFALAPAGAHAIVFYTGAEGGDLDGHSFLIVDVNGDAAYTATLDYVIDITGGDFTGLGVGNFI
jgi:Ca2+-binding RTX toxin-like protein